MQNSSDGRDVSAASKPDMPRVRSTSSNIPEVLSVIGKVYQFTVCLGFFMFKICEYKPMTT